MIERICIIALVSLLFFAKTLTYKYASDDLPANARENHPNKWIQWLFVLEGRARSTPQIDHFITTIIHTLICIFIYIGFGANDVSFLAALLFCFNPTNNQGSVWIAGRGYAFPTLGLTMALSIPFLAPLFLLGATYYNAGFVMPLIFAGSDYSWFLWFMPIIWLFHYRRFSNNVLHKVKQEMFAEDRQIKPEKLVLATKTFGFYTTLALIPFKTTFYHSFLQSAAGCGKDKAYTMKDRFFWFGLAYIIGIAYFWLSRPWDMVSFGLLWWCLGIAPFLNIVRIHQEIAERYAYLPMVGLMFVLASGLINFPFIAPAVIAVYATKLWFYMDAFQDDFYLVEFSRLLSPQSWFAWHVSAMKRWDAKSHQEAIIYWTMARMLSPKEFKLNLNIATALALSTNPAHREEAKAFLKIAEDNIPGGQEETAGRLIKEWKEGKFAIVL